MTHNIEDYPRAYKEFKWQIPATFNFGTDVVDHWALTADGPALIWCNAAGEERRYNFSDIARLSGKLADGLQRRGVQKGDRVVIMLPRIPEWQIAMVACMKLGAVPIPCIEMLTPKDLAYRIDNAGARAVIARAEHAAKFTGMYERLPVRISVGKVPGWDLIDALIEGGSEDFKPAAVAAEDPALLYYTSGSTGNPKGVLHASRAIYAWREVARSWLDLRPGDTIWCTADTGWSKAGTSILLGPWSMGACSFFYDGPFDPKERLRLLEKYRVTVYCAPGTELFRLVDEKVGEHDLGALRHVVSAGEALSPVIAQRWEQASGIPVAEAYGQTESLMTLINVPGTTYKVGSMGIPNLGSVLEILDDAGNVVPTGEEGDVALLAPNPQLMLGYWQEPGRTAQCYLTAPDGRQWFITGDRGVRDTDGFYYHRGRRDDVINSAGYRIGPAEVENAILDHPSVLETAVIGIADAERGELVKAFIVLRPGFTAGDALKKELQDHVKRTTAPYKYPRAIEFIAELPKTMTGKIQRVALRTMEKERAVKP